MKIALTQRVGILAATALLASGLAGAAPVVQTVGSKATGIQDLVVDGVNYDVSFVFGSYNSVFGSSTPTFFGNELGATHAKDAMWSLLNGSKLTIGINGSQGNLAVIWDDNPNDHSWWAAKWAYYTDGTGTVWKNQPNLTGPKNRDNTPYNIAFALFTADPIHVPEPGSAALVGIALLGLGFSSRRKQR